jgi:Uma2 family endonuclease
MRVANIIPPKPPIHYPESDGLPMAENSLQFRYIVTIQGGLDTLFRDDLNVFVAGDMFWYPVEGHPEIRVAPDTLVVFGRPKGDRGSYQQWNEGNIAPQVVFEVLSPSNRFGELLLKFQFYERYGVEEYYIYDPDHGTLEGWRRSGEQFQGVAEMNGWVSPRLGVRFELTPGGELHLYAPDGQRFATYLELAAQRDEERRAREQAQQRATEAQQEATEAQQEATEAQQEATEAKQKATEALQKAAEAQQKAARLAEQLRALGVEPEA